MQNRIVAVHRPGNVPIVQGLTGRTNPDKVERVYTNGEFALMFFGRLVDMSGGIVRVDNQRVNPLEDPLPYDVKIGIITRLVSEGHGRVFTLFNGAKLVVLPTIPSEATPDTPLTVLYDASKIHGENPFLAALEQAEVDSRIGSFPAVPLPRKFRDDFRQNPLGAFARFFGVLFRDSFPAGVFSPSSGGAFSLFPFGDTGLPVQIEIGPDLSLPPASGTPPPVALGGAGSAPPVTPAGGGAAPAGGESAVSATPHRTSVVVAESPAQPIRALLAQEGFMVPVGVFEGGGVFIGERPALRSGAIAGIAGIAAGRAVAPAARSAAPVSPPRAPTIIAH